MGRPRKKEKNEMVGTTLPPEYVDYIDNYLKVSASKFLRDATMEKIEKLKRSE